MSIKKALREARLKRRLPPPEARRVLRQRVGLAQAVIAREIGVTRVAVSRWESGQRTPRGRLLVRYVEILDRLAGELTVR